MPPGDLFRYAFLTLVFLVVAGFGLKWWGKYKEQKRIVAELRTLTNPTSSFEQFYAEEATKALYQSMYQLHLAEDRLDKEPHVVLGLVFDTESPGNLLGSGGYGSDDDLDPREILIRSSLLRNYENCKRLAVFSDSVAIDSLSRGEAPQIQSGPARGQFCAVRYIIPPSVSPGSEKIIPNLVIVPPDEGPGGEPTEFDVAQAKSLAYSLQRAGLLEHEARDRIVKHYEMLGTPAKGAGEER